MRCDLAGGRSRSSLVAAAISSNDVCTFSGQAERHDRFPSAVRRSGGRWPAGGIRSCRLGVIAPGTRAVARPRTGRPCSSLLSLRARLRPADTASLGQWPLTASCAADRDARACARWSVANRSAIHPTRLETRTKESNMCASHWDFTKPKGEMKVKAATGSA